MPQFIKTSVARQVGTITLARADVHNALNDVFMAELSTAFAEFGADAKVRAIVLGAEGKSFCAGADIHWMKRMIAEIVDELK